MTIQTRSQRIGTIAGLALLTALAGCSENEKLIGTGASLTTTPCQTCADAERPQCAEGSVAACFKRTDGQCGWASTCVMRPAADAGMMSTPDAGTTTCPPQVCTAIACPNGNKKDPNGCATCECNLSPDAGPICPPQVCPAIACPNGNKVDANGCITCHCNPAPTPDACALILCPPETRCELQEVMCVAAPCPPVARCVPVKPEPNPCAAVLCPVGTVCKVTPVTCVRAPCPPVAECVPQVRCGGIAGLRCPGSGTCQDDPTDSCDPARGGADCGGLCQCKSLGDCPPDRIWDGSPAVCACVPVPTGTQCGKKVCTDAEYCCNASCSTCAPKGGACDANLCQP